MTKQSRRRFSPEYEEQAVAQLSEPGVTHAAVAAELGETQLKAWRLELEAAGSAAAIER